MSNVLAFERPEKQLKRELASISKQLDKAQINLHNLRQDFYSAHVAMIDDVIGIILLKAKDFSGDDRDCLEKCVAALGGQRLNAMMKYRPRLDA